jgi:alpha-1,3-mannosyltransferase
VPAASSNLMSVTVAPPHQSQQSHQSHQSHQSSQSTSQSRLRKNLFKLFHHLAEARYDVPFIALLCLAEVVLCLAVINMVAYTEIDWIAYMQEVEGWWLHGEHDYRLLRGDTGPLVYPAGFLYFFCILRYLTHNGRNIRRAQHLFAAFYLIQSAIVFLIYTRVLRCRQRSVASIWSWRLAMGMLCLSKRLHSIFLLRLFNDGIAMLFLYVSIFMFMKNSWKWGCLCFSLGVSIKMNVLLFAPGLLLLLLQSQSSLKGTIICLIVCASSQLILGAPFLFSYPESYLRKAFELDRVFFFKWTVNLKVR